MKTIITLFAVLLSVVGLAQNPMFVHLATNSNSSFNVSYLDHPDLNGNPSAKILVSHNWNPGNGTGVYNNKRTGVWYDAIEQRWSVYNEDTSNMIIGSSYNVYIMENVSAITHIATLSNQGSLDSYSVVNHPLLNGNPDADAVLTTYYNPNGVYNDHNYGFWYNDTTDRWTIYTEDLGMLPLDSAFFIGVPGNGVEGYTHSATAGNISGNWTEISHPFLDGNPDAMFVYTHNWGSSGEPSNVILDHTTGAWYTGTNWAIFNEDLAPMPVGAEFDLLIFDETLGTEENVIEGLSYFPNPVQDIATIRANQVIESVTVFNILGQELAKVKGTTNQIQLNLSSYATGNYFAQVTAGDAVETIKLVKQ